VECCSRNGFCNHCSRNTRNSNQLSVLASTIQGALNWRPPTPEQPTRTAINRTEPHPRRRTASIPLLFIDLLGLERQFCVRSFAHPQYGSRIILILRRRIMTARAWFVDRGRRGKLTRWQSSCVRTCTHASFGESESHPRLTQLRPRHFHGCFQ